MKEEDAEIIRKLNASLVELIKTSELKGLPQKTKLFLEKEIPNICQAIKMIEKDISEESREAYILGKTIGRIEGVLAVFRSAKTE